MVRATPLEKRLVAPDLVEGRKEKTVTVTETSTLTNTETINQTTTLFITSEFFSTIFTTITVPTTIQHTVTQNVSVPTTTTLVASPPPSIISMYNALSVARVGQELVPISSTSQGGHKESSKLSGPASTPLTTQPPNPPDPAIAVPTPAAVVPSSQTHKLSAPVILGIVLGVLAFIGLLLAGLIFARRMYRMYRQQRVMRKQIQTEGNPMPVIAAAGETARNDGFDNEETIGGKPYEADQKHEVWEEYPPAYSTRV